MSRVSVSTRRQARLVLAGTCLAVTCLGASTVIAVADPYATRGNLGGGFIEFLMTGSTPSHRQGAPIIRYHEPAPAMRRSAPVSAAPVYAPPAHMASRSAVPSASYGYVDPVDSSELPDMPDVAPVAPQRRRSHAEPPVRAFVAPQYERQEVTYPGSHAPGTVVIDTPNRYLYLVQGGGRALRYGIGVGRPGFEWAGVKAITRKAEWPDWRPPAQMLRRRPDLPRHMAGGPDNPLGARAMYLGSSLYRIHGTNEPETIGQAVSSGCIRMRNEDVVDLYQRVRVGTRVLVI